MRSSSRTGQPAARPADQPRQSIDLDREVARIGAMNVAELRIVWRTKFGAEAPAAFSRDLLVRAVAHRIQEEALGGLSPSTARLLRSLLKSGAEPPRQVKVGSVIVREHKGVAHEVLVVPGGFCWQGRTYDSLSTIAKKITGVSWNGPRFFGLRSKKDAPQEQADGGTANRSTSEAGMLGEPNAPRRPGRRSSLRSTSSSPGACT